MSLNATSIGWCDYTLNLHPFCSRGCPYCYRERVTYRLSCQDCRDNRPHFHEDRVKCLTHRADAPGWVFVNSIGETFDTAMRPEWLAPLWAAVPDSPHQIIIVTKRPDIISPNNFPWHRSTGRPWPDNLWLLTTAETQSRLDRRLMHLLSACPAGRLGLSLEPLLGRITIGANWLHELAWVIVGGLSGPWLPPGWSLAESLREAQGMWAADLAGQVARHNRAGGNVALWIKTEPVKLPSPAPHIQERPTPGQVHQPAMTQAGLF